MRAVRHTEHGVRVVEVDRPDHPGVRVRPRAVSICQTDINLVKLGPRQITLGHEFAGITDDGTPVAVEPLVPCGVAPNASGTYDIVIEGDGSEALPEQPRSPWPSDHRVGLVGLGAKIASSRVAHAQAGRDTSPAPAGTLPHDLGSRPSARCFRRGEAHRGGGRRR